MIKITQDEIAKWRLEIDNAEKFRENEFGKNNYKNVTKAGENIDYFENGLSGRLIQNLKSDEAYPLTTINIIYPIVKNVIPTLY